MRRYRAVWVPSWFERARPRSFSRNSIAAVMEHAQRLVDSGEARVVCVFRREPRSPMYEVNRTYTRVRWPEAG